MKAQMLISLGMALLLATLVSAQETNPAAPTPIQYTREGILPQWLGVNWDFQPQREARMWAGIDYQVVWMQGVSLPPLVTTSPAGTARVNAGVLNAPGTETLFSGSVNNEMRSGVRLNAGYWFNPQQSLGIEVGFNIIESQSGIFTASSTNGAILARPFLNTNAQTQQAVLIAFPGSSNGTIDIRARSGNFYEGHIDLTENAYDNDFFRLYSMVGYRFYRYDEGTRINQTISPTDPLFVAGTTITTNDRFNTRNEFHGIDLGFRSEFFWDKLSVELLTKVAVGRLFRSIDINGDQTIAVPGAAPVVQSAGLYALSPNTGLRSQSEWKVMPEVGVTFNYRIRPNTNLRFGYSVIVLQSIAQASEQIDQSINTNFLPGATGTGGANLPAFRNVTSDQWIQSVNFGVEFRY